MKLRFDFIKYSGCELDGKSKFGPLRGQRDDSKT